MGMSGSMGGRLGVAVALAVALIGGCTRAGTSGQPSDPAVAATRGGTPVSPSALHALYSQPHREDGVVLSGAHAGAHWIKWTKPDGSLELSAAHGLFADTGHYVLKNDAVCARWSHIDDGHENCMRLVKTGADSYVSLGSDGKPGSSFHVRPSDGNGSAQN